MLVALGTSAINAETPIDFQRDIRPILTEHCAQCHGPDEGARQADLRLDVRDAAVSESSVIVPGKPDQSELLSRVASSDPDIVMPPPDHNKPLNDMQKALLRQWIAEGAPYSGHWAYTSPSRPLLPEVDGAHHPIDAFVIDRAERDGLEMSPPAPLGVLCRRIYLDIIGLPPSPQQLDEFLDAARADFPATVEALVDHLLESEHYGEKWARHWLDVARYADSNGYEKDVVREQWAWRDWVINAFNSDQPYNQFIVEQIAGDLLPDRTQEQLIATGFLRNGMVNEEGAIVFEQFRMEGIFDRMDCIGKAVLGLSMQCAQCHTHKFDPISQDEYYGMFAFLNDTFEARSWVYNAEQKEKISEIENSVRAVEERLVAARPDWQQELAAWEERERAAAPKWDVLDLVENEWIGGVNHPKELSDHTVVLLGHPTTGGDMYVIAEPDLTDVTGLRIEALTFGDLPFGGPGRNYRGVFAISEVKVEVQEPGKDDWTKLELKEVTADFSEEERLVDQPLQRRGEPKEEKRKVGPVSFLIDGDESTGWSADRGPGLRNTDSVAVLRFAETLTAPPNSKLKISLAFESSPSGGVRECTQAGRTRYSLTRSPNPRAASYDHAATLAMQSPAAKRNLEEQAAVRTAWRRSTPELKPFDDEVSVLERQHPEAYTSVLTTLKRSPEHRRGTFLLDRGIWDKPTHEVTPHVPTALHSLDEENPGRLAFAHWLVDRRSPLAARVQVNRVWQTIFGIGLVETPEDFGTRSVQPEHLELLDWLAVEFMDHGWSTKRLIRTILTSTTYQQNSRWTQKLSEIDPQNRLLLRGPRFRTDAEVLRDIALSTAGLLHPRIGGPSTYPPIPATVLADTFSRPGYWETDEGPERYRRALYIFRKRSMPDPVMTTFDAPNADFACARRQVSNTPLAALIPLNETIFVEAARALALRILREGGDSEAERINYAFRLCMSRSPTTSEVEVVSASLKNHRVRLADGFISINEIATGDPAKKPEFPKGTTPQDAAAWTILARVLINTNEMMTKN